MNAKKITLNLIQIVLVVFLVLIATFSFATKLPFFSRLGLNFFAVTSGSMEPAIPVGSLIYAGKYKLEDLKPQQIIVFKVKDAQSGAISTVTHRIVDVLKEVNNETFTDDSGKEVKKEIVKYDFATKGDANNVIDPRTVPAANLIGLYQWHLPYLGYLVSFAQSGRGFVVTVVFPAMVLIVWELTSLTFAIKHHYQQKNQSEINSLKAQLAALDKHPKRSKK